MYDDLIKTALSATEKAYVPFSKFRVGAALLCDNGNVYSGCNIENSSFPATICAERTAFSKAISEGEMKFKAICVVGGKDGVITDYCYPCGVCRQFMAEFCDDEFEIILYNGEDVIIKKLSEIFPEGFKSNGNF